ncbi:MAG TPA: hypothetical protein DCZ82_01275 [Candidatus Levybacteria bacterium]|nr:hypothetical protein [Candidatus Levybacteria bacterium]
MAENLTKKEKREQRRQEWQEKTRKEEKSQMIRKYTLWGGAAIGFLAVLLIFIKLAGTSSTPVANREISNFPPVSADDITYGSTSAKVSLIEYSDFQCPACAAYYPTVKKIKEAYKYKIVFVYRNFPLRQNHKNAEISARAGYAAHKQGKFWEMHDMLFENQGSWSGLNDPKDTFIEYAQKLGLDLEKFKTDINSSESKDFVTSQERQALSLGVNSTPTFFLNAKLLRVNANYEEFKKVIDEELGK